MAKNNGRTVLGVRIGLFPRQLNFAHTASAPFHLLPCLQSLLSKRRICNLSVLSQSRITSTRSLAGLLLFCFLSLTWLCGSWESMESSCPIGGCVSAIVKEFRDHEPALSGLSSRWRGVWWLEMASTFVVAILQCCRCSRRNTS